MHDWRGPQHEGDTSIGADDGTRWVHSPHSDGFDWTGFVPGEDGCWLQSQATMERDYPEVVAALAGRHR